MHARRPFAQAAEDDQLGGGGAAHAAAVTAEDEAAVLDEEEQDCLVEQLRQESDVAIWWTRVVLSIVLVGIACLHLLLSDTRRGWFFICLTDCGLATAGLSLGHLPRLSAAVIPNAYVTALGVGLAGPSIVLSAAQGRFWDDLLLGHVVGLALAVVARRWIDGLEEDVRTLEGKKYTLKGA